MSDENHKQLTEQLKNCATFYDWTFKQQEKFIEEQRQSSTDFDDFFNRMSKYCKIDRDKLFNYYWR